MQAALRGPRRFSDLKNAGQTETINKAGVKAAKENMLELIQIQKARGDLERPKKDYND